MDANLILHQHLLNAWAADAQPATLDTVCCLLHLAIQGHATTLMVQEGLVSAMDKYGNDQSDDAANRGAASPLPHAAGD